MTTWQRYGVLDGICAVTETDERFSVYCAFGMHFRAIEEDFEVASRWCRDNCSGKWSVFKGEIGILCFENEADTFLFILSHEVEDADA